jgi:hypothetical protein
MKLKSMFLEGYTRMPRHEAIAECEKVIMPYGFVTDFKMFSNCAINLVIEAVYSKVPQLVAALQREDFLEIDKFNDPNSEVEGPDTDKEVILYFNLTFGHNNPDLVIEVPAVPG